MFNLNCLQVEIGLLKYLSVKFSQHHRISVERVVSGPGLANVRVLVRSCSMCYVACLNRFMST